MKIKAISAIISCLFAVLAAGLVYTQLLNYPRYNALSRNNRIRLIPVEGRRGSLYDRRGALLVGARPSFDAVVIPQELKNSFPTLKRVSEILGIPPKETFRRVEKNYTAPFAPIMIMRDIDKQKAIMLEEEGHNLRGIMVRPAPKREYRFNEVGSHIFGYLGEIDSGELGRLKGYGYQIKDAVGKAGLEKFYDTYLKGEEGGMQLEVNNRGFFMRTLGRKESTAGKELTLTIDIRLQEFIEKQFGDKAGACVVMQPYTGEVLALVSKPAFNPNVFLNPEKEADMVVFLKDPGRPMINRAVSGLYPPGSVFKPVVAAAALENKKIGVNDRFFCGGKYTLGSGTFRCWDEEGHGTESVWEGLKNSCNVFFYQVGRLAGADDISNFAGRFGYGAPTGIDLPEEAAGLIPNRQWKRLVRKEPWFEGDTLNYSIGQGYVLVTPIQVVRMMATIANGGYLIQPYIVKRIGGVEVATVRAQNTGISKKTLDIIKIGLRKVVADETGTGRRAKVEGMEIAGKTGTAQNPQGASHAWFAGFSPVDQPKLALVVFIEHGGKGGLDAAEIASETFAEARRIGLL